MRTASALHGIKVIIINKTINSSIQQIFSTDVQTLYYLLDVYSTCSAAQLLDSV
uniref:Uncharacterized protein n=1 Tax=Arion vulgaris TaxID=1028688 RepID=A0A0B6Z5C7_9EUPU